MSLEEIAALLAKAGVPEHALSAAELRLPGADRDSPCCRIDRAAFEALPDQVHGALYAMHEAGTLQVTGSDSTIEVYG